jgi:hypothetical protein
LYTSKSTQDEDSKKQLRIEHAFIKKIKCLLDQNQTNCCDQTTSEPSFGEDLSRFLSGLNAATKTNVISSTMAHLQRWEKVKLAPNSILELDLFLPTQACGCRFS